MQKENERNRENQTFLLEPLLALTGSLSLSQTDAVSPVKCDIPRQHFLSSTKLGLPEAILWLVETVDVDHSPIDDEKEFQFYGWLKCPNDGFGRKLVLSPWCHSRSRIREILMLKIKRDTQRVCKKINSGNGRIF